MISDHKKALVQGWMKKGGSDLQSARLLICGTEKHLDTGVYHCQQAAEKYIKAWLTAGDLPFRKTHDLDLLLQECGRIDESVFTLKAHLELLTPLATEFRYPGDLFEPSQEDAQQALRSSEIVCQFFINKLDHLKYI